MLRLAVAVAVLTARAVAGRSFYDVLRVGEDASERQIKRAFRKLSLKFHPDKCREDDCQERFMEVNRAYEVLSDPHKRRQYDRFGEDGVKEDGAPEEAAPMDPFDMFFGGGRRRQEGPRRGPDKVVALEVTLRDVYEGRSVTYRHRRRKVCAKCRGSGAASKDHIHKCPVCGGSGLRIVTQQLAPGFIQQVQAECDHCGGSGVVVDRPCPLCGGHGLVEAEEEVEVFVERGMADGADITFEHGGDEQKDERAGHLVFRLQTAPHPAFRREGSDLHTELTLSLAESLIGFSREIEHLDGHAVEVTAVGVTRPAQTLRVEGEGMPLHEDPSSFGDLHVHVAVQFPEDLSPAQRAAVERVM